MSKLVNMDGAIEVLAALCFNPDSHEEETESFDAAWDRAYIDAERLLKPHVIEGEAEREGERDVERLLDLARQHRASAEHCRQYAEWLESEEAAEVPGEEKFGSAEDAYSDAVDYAEDAILYERVARRLAAQDAPERPHDPSSAIRLLDSWLADQSGYDEEAWAEIKRAVLGGALERKEGNRHG